jgi:hypothetical protein
MGRSPHAVHAMHAVHTIHAVHAVHALTGRQSHSRRVRHDPVRLETAWCSPARRITPARPDPAYQSGCRPTPRRAGLPSAPAIAQTPSPQNPPLTIFPAHPSSHSPSLRETSPHTHPSHPSFHTPHTPPLTRLIHPARLRGLTPGRQEMLRLQKEGLCRCRPPPSSPPPPPRTPPPAHSFISTHSPQATPLSSISPQPSTLQSPMVPHSSKPQ